jgi:CHASE2 domain-containing sensor protein/signal transduction histidine kinase
VLKEWCAIFALLGALVGLASWQGWLWRVDQTLYDNAILLQERPAYEGIVIVGIDDDSLAQVGRWPWRRDIHALALERLKTARPKAVILDLVLSERDATFPTGDEALASAIKANGNVVLPVTMQASGGRVTGEALPAPLFAQVAGNLSHIAVSLDPDGLLRTVHLQGGFGAPRYDLSPLAALRMAEPDVWPSGRMPPGQRRISLPTDAGLWLQDAWYHIPFVGPPGHFKSVSYVDVLTMPEAALASVFSEKYVFIGATAPSMADAYPTPGSGRNSRAMPGIEIQANVLQALIEGRQIWIADVFSATTVAISFLFCAMLAFPLLSPRGSLIVALGVAFASLVVSALLFKLFYWWWSPAVTFLAVLLAYPLWSWRKLEATQRYLDSEIDRLNREPIIVPFAAPSPGQSMVVIGGALSGMIESRIASVQAAAERLRGMNRFVAESVESLPDATLVTNADGVVLLANSSADALFKARRVKVDPNRGRMPDIPLEGRHVVSLLEQFSSPAGAPWRETWADAYEETRSLSFETQFADSRDFLVRMAPLFSTRGVQTGLIISLIDVSPLRESERRRDEALRFLSHDMRSPQASILTLLSMYRDDPESITADKLVVRIEKYSRRTLNLADEFLRLAKAERARSEDFSLFDLAETIRDAIDEAWSNASAKFIRIDFPDHDEALMLGDRDLLTRALVNLLSNAVKYSPPRTAISVDLRQDDDQWMLTVADQGYGIAAHDLSRLFTRFQRFKHEGQPEEDGVGLGLVFVKTVVERHGGRIHVASKVASANDPAQGTVFHLALPTAPKSAGTEGDQAR